MKITIDDKECLKHKLTFEELIVALMFKQVHKIQETVKNLINRGVLVQKDGSPHITKEWSGVIDEIICDSSDSTSDERLLQLAEKMRAAYPAGRHPDKYGRPSPYLYRCNRGEIVKKLKKFFAEHGDYSDEEIINATKRYVAAFGGNYKFLPLLKYFISKMKDEEDEDGNTHKVEYSPLADYLENEEVENDVAPNRDWTTKMV